MDQENQIDHLFPCLNYNDIFQVSSLHRYKRIMTLLNQLRAMKEDVTPNICKIVQHKWDEFFKKLCEFETYGEELNTFLNRTVSFTDEFFDYSIFVVQCILKCNLHEDRLYKKLLEEGNQKQLIRALKENCSSIPTKVCYKYLQIRVLPAIFATETTEEERKELCDVVLALPLGFAYNFMTKEEQQSFKEDVIKKYVPYLSSQCRCSKDWHQMCKVLIHYPGRLLHTETSLTNAILKIVELAFKNSTVEDRCAAYECWKVLIDNYSLDKKYLMHPKQTGLLVKPLRAKISRNRIVAIKKFDTYVHLMQQMDFAKNHLEQFLVYAFGPFDEEVNDFIFGDSVRHLRDINSTCPKSTEILLKILGHDKSECCCRNLPITDIFNISIAQVLQETYSWDVLVNCVRLCSQVNWNWLKEESRETIVKCLWNSILKLLKQPKYHTKLEDNLKSIRTSIIIIINSSFMDKIYYDTFLKLILECIINYLYDTDYHVSISNGLVLGVINELIVYQSVHSDKLPNSVYQDSVKKFLEYCKQDADFLKNVSNIVLNAETCECQLAADICNYLFELCAKEKRDVKLAMQHLDRLIRLNANMNINAPTFKKDVGFLIANHSTLLLDVFDGFISNGTCLLGVLKIASMLVNIVVDENSIKDTEFYTRLLTLVHKSLLEFSRGSPKHKKDVIQGSDVVINALKFLVGCKQRHNELKIECPEMLQIFISLLKLGMYNCCDPLSIYMNYIDNSELPAEFYELIGTKDEVDWAKALAIFKKARKNELALSPPKAAPKVTVVSNTVITTSPKSSLRIFGKKVTTLSPRKERSSVPEHRKSALELSPKNGRPVSTLPNIEDISESAFVVIDKQVEFNPEKMSEHQKEVAVKRPEDIPALYSELTQTQSQDNGFFGRDADNTKENEESTRPINNSTELSPPKNTEEPQRRRGRKPVTYMNTDIDFESLDERARRELSNLELDIVGGNGFKNLPRARCRRTRLVDNAIDSSLNHVRGGTYRVNKSELASKKCYEDSLNAKKPEEVKNGPELNSENLIPATQDYSDELRVNLFRLPCLSPTKKELDECKKQKMKGFANIKKCNAVAKLNFSNSANSQNQTISPNETQKKRNSRSPDNKTEQSGITANDETMTLDICTINYNIAELENGSFAGPEKVTDRSLIVSPVTSETSSKLKEFLDSTLDISPIKGDGEKDSPDLFAGGEPNKQPNGDVACVEEERLELDQVRPVEQDANIDDVYEFKIDDANEFKADEAATLKHPSSRSAKLVNLSVNHSRLIPPRLRNDKCEMPGMSTPKTDRVKKMMRKCNEGSKSSTTLANSEFAADEILEFVRPVPSPMAQPGISILKRKVPETIDDNITPLAKRKRVNFSDPPISCEKVYFKGAAEEKAWYVDRHMIQQLEDRFLEDDVEHSKKSPEKKKNQIPQKEGEALLEMEGVAPLQESPKKRSTTPLDFPSNPAPELLDSNEASRIDFTQLFPSSSQNMTDAREQYEGQKQIMQAIFKTAKTFLNDEDYLNVCLKDIPFDTIQKWIKEHKPPKGKATKRRKKNINKRV